MTVTIGMGDYVYDYVGDWARHPAGQSFQNPSAVAVDSFDRVYVFQRQGPPILVFDREGHFLAPWPRREGELEDAHDIFIGPDDGVYLADRDSHQVLKYSTEGELLMALGNRHQASLQAPFNHPIKSPTNTTHQVTSRRATGETMVFGQREKTQRKNITLGNRW